MLQQNMLKKLTTCQCGYAYEYVRALPLSLSKWEISYDIILHHDVLLKY
jgi:hypothetical protein